LSLPNCSAEEYDTAVSDSLGVNASQFEDTSTKLTTSWDYLSKEWKTILLGNSVVRGIDSFFQQISVVFLVLFAMDYSMSFLLLFVILIWIYALVFLYNGFKNFSLFSKGVSFIISLGLVIAMAHMKILEVPANGLVWLFFGEKEWWVKLIIGVVVLFFLVMAFLFLKKFGKQFKEKRQKKRDEMNRMKLEQGAKVGEELTKAASEGE
jgi:hypothetical protein